MLACGLAALVLVGCATDDGGGGALERSVAAAERAAARLTGSDQGLEIRKWLVTAPPMTIDAVLDAHGDAAFLDADGRRRLERNGLRLLAVERADVPALLADLGGADLDISAWHGQMLDWRPVHEIELGRGTITLAVDGRMRPVTGGHLSLLGRSWTVRTEDGPRLQLELVPAHRAPGPRVMLPETFTRRHTSDDRPYASLALDLRLEAGRAYVLSAAVPGPDDDEADALGPDATPPPTVGELLLAPPNAPGRGMLLMLPRIPDEMFPTPLPANSG